MTNKIFDPIPDPNSNRTKKKKARKIQTKAPHLEKRHHKRAKRRGNPGKHW